MQGRGPELRHCSGGVCGRQLLAADLDGQVGGAGGQLALGRSLLRGVQRPYLPQREAQLLPPLQPQPCHVSRFPETLAKLTRNTS